jgi:hypothetical protein
LEGHTDAVWSAAFSPDGQRIVTASRDHTARIWDAATGKTIAALEGHTDAVLTAVFSPDGQRIVTASSDATARIWDVSRSGPFVRERSIVLTAALARGIGSRTSVEAGDLLLQDAPGGGDLFAEALAQLGRKPDDPQVAEMVALLSAPLHPNCYLSPTQLAEKFLALAANSGEKPPEPDTEVSHPAVASHSKRAGKLPASATVRPRRRRWPRALGLITLLVVLGLGTLVAFGQIDARDIAQRSRIILPH